MRLNNADTPIDKEVPAVLNRLLANIFALHLKTKNFHWHMSGSLFRDYHLLLDDHASQLFEMTDSIAERVRKLGATTLRSIGHIARLQTIADNDSEHVPPPDMLSELCVDEIALGSALREAHALCENCGDVATTSLIENWIDESQRRAWFLSEATRES
jgi:starvation-inducible DNA-binding protein